MGTHYWGTPAAFRCDHVIVSLHRKLTDMLCSFLHYTPPYLRQSKGRFSSGLHRALLRQGEIRTTPNWCRPVIVCAVQVILSTNIAETSITIDDVVYVVDAGKVREKTYDAYTGCSSLKSVWVSQVNRSTSALGWCHSLNEIPSVLRLRRARERGVRVVSGRALLFISSRASATPRCRSLPCQRCYGHRWMSYACKLSCCTYMRAARFGRTSFMNFIQAPMSHSHQKSRCFCPARYSHRPLRLFILRCVSGLHETRIAKSPSRTVAGPITT